MHYFVMAKKITKRTKLGLKVIGVVSVIGGSRKFYITWMLICLALTKMGKGQEHEN